MTLNHPPLRTFRNPLLPLALGLTAWLAGNLAAANPDTVRLWEEDLDLPSYRLGAPDPNPMFYRGESYQGAEKRVYPYALMDAITGERESGRFRAVYLENEYLKVCVLPEIGGRLFYATDKSNGYDFFYRQHVVKPALIGMLGAWISGGIEWCVFHHHRNTTHLPVDYALREHADGSKTLWIGETERRHRMRWLIGMTLHPGKSYLEVAVRMVNRTPMPHSILYWANVAVAANEDYQVIFPPSVQVATYHAKNDFVHWPIGQGRYQGSDYTGVDLSWWKNHPRQISCFAWDLQEDFMGGYDHGRQAGVVHVGDHHVISGAKLWEWAPGNIWDTRILTDSDGPYAELMVGAFSDNQPDYSWIQPLEVKRFTQYWYPVQAIGGFKNANLNAALNLDLDGTTARVAVAVTSDRPGSRVLLQHGDKILLDQTVDAAPDHPWAGEVELPTALQATELKAQLLDAHGNTLIVYQPKHLPPVEELPARVEPPPAPDTIDSIERLFYTGLRVEQIYQPRVDATDYYREALRRDPEDVRCNTMMGIHYNRRGLYEDAEQHLRRAIHRMTTDYTRARDTEPYYQLGLTLKAQDRLEEAYDAFFRATWDAAFHATGHFQLATLDCRRSDWQRALEHIEESLSTQHRNVRGWNLKTAILRHLGETEEAQRLAQSIAREDPLDRWSRNEWHRLQTDGAPAAEAIPESSWPQNLGDDLQAWLELAADYLDAGLTDDAIAVLERVELADARRREPSPLTAYYLAHLHREQGRTAEALGWAAKAARRSPDYCFPFRLETADVLKSARELNPQDGRAAYYLGNLLYELQPDRALALWEEARELEPSLGVVHRNLGWAYLRHSNDPGRAIASYERAVECNPDAPRYYLELDDLYQRANAKPATRLAMLQRNNTVTDARKDLLIRRIRLLVVHGDTEPAIAALATNQFFISEGGGRELGDTYVDAHLLQGLKLLRVNRPAEARALFVAAASYPENLSQESPANDRRMPQIRYYTALAELASGNPSAAEESLRAVTEAGSARSREMQFYQALAWTRLGDQEQAGAVARRLVEWASGQLEGAESTDVFAKFGEQETQQEQRAEAHYVLGLGLLGLERGDEAARHFEQTLTANQAHVWASYHLAALQQP